MAGLVFGIQRTIVTPPARAAEVPLSKSSLYSAPGWRKCTWTSIRPGNRTIFPEDMQSICVFTFRFFPTLWSAYNQVKEERVVLKMIIYLLLVLVIIWFLGLFGINSQQFIENFQNRGTINNLLYPYASKKNVISHVISTVISYSEPRFSLHRKIQKVIFGSFCSTFHTLSTICPNLLKM